MNSIISSDSLNLDDVEKGIVLLFEDVGPKIHCKSLSESTRKVMESFKDLGEKFDFETCPCNYNSEFLYDLIWYRNEKHEFESLSIVPLVLESEWDMRIEQIKYDFEKLLISKSQYKIMVFQSDTNESDITSLLIKIIQNYKAIQEGEIYIFACFDNNIGKFVIRKYCKENNS